MVLYYNTHKDYLKKAFENAILLMIMLSLRGKLIFSKVNATVLKLTVIISSL